MNVPESYSPLTATTLRDRFGGFEQVVSSVGAHVSPWLIREIGDGNLKLGFVVTGKE